MLTRPVVTLAILGMLSAAGLLSGGCDPSGMSMRGRGGSRSSAGPLDVWIAGDMVGLTQTTPRRSDLDLYDPLNRNVSLMAGANETVSFQIVLDGGAGGVRGVRIEWADLETGVGIRIPASAIRAWRMLPLTDGTYDPLAEIDASASPAPTFDVPPGGRLAIWVDVALPKSAGPGKYKANLGLTAADGRKWSASLGVEVMSFVLPDARPIAALGSFGDRELMGALLQRNGRPFDPVYLDRDNPMVRRGLMLVRKLMRLAHAHRIDLFDTDIKPLIKRAGVDKVRLTWGDYDAIVGPYLDGSAFDDHVGVGVWPSPVTADWPDPQYYGGAGSQTYEAVVSQVLAESRRHLATNLLGLTPGGTGEAAAHLARPVLVWPVRNPAGPQDYATHMALAALARKAVPDVPIVTQLPPHAPPGSGWSVPAGFTASADIFAPSGELFDPNMPAELRQKTRPKGLTPACWLAAGPAPYLPAIGPDTAPADARALPWFAAKYGCEAVLLGDVLGWSGNVLSPAPAGKARLFYPGTIAGLEEPLASVRLKRLRRGLQDTAYLWILGRHDKRAVARRALDEMIRYGGLGATRDSYLDCRLGGWVSDGATWSLARHVLAVEVQAAVASEKAAMRAELSHRLAVARLKKRTESLEIERVRTAVGPAPGSKHNPPARLQMSLQMEVFNRHDQAAAITARPTNLPPGWKLTDAGTVTLRPDGLGTLKLEAQGPAPLPTDAGARMGLLVELTGEASGPRRAELLVPFLVAGQAKQKLTIDGDLRDWPSRPGNTAGGFVPLRLRGLVSTARARRQTMVFVLRDAENLYLAFRCQEPSPADMVVRPSNRVHYEHLVASGEDLVEVLLDPGAGATRPDELYHLVVKPNGVCLTERGVSCEPALGKTQPWAAGATLAVGKAPGAWTVEIAIPLSSLGKAGQSAFWGANFMRYSPADRQASSWTPASRYFYDPRNLGTIFVGTDVDSGR